MPLAQDEPRKTLQQRRGRRTVDLEISGLKALDIYRLAEIADRLDVSVDWLLGRSNVMEVPNENGRRLS